MNHSLCNGCWVKREGVRTPIRIKPEHAFEETCCGCGEKHKSGIYQRGPVAEFPKCTGDH